MKNTGWLRVVLIGAAMLLQTGCATMSGLAAARPKPWRLIVNDDGEIPPPNANRSLAQTLDDRFNSTRGTQVDAYFLCIASTDRVVAPAAARPQDAMSQWAKYGDVPEHVDQMIRAYIDAAHAEGMDIVLAARLNDIHDAWAEKLTYPLKVERPDLLLGTKENWPSDALMQAHWSGFNWAEPEVRAHFLAFLLWACERWDFDGLELDWFRHPLFFRFGEEEANVENINQFVRDVRTGLDRIAAARKRQYLLTTRVPDTPKLARRTGFDVEQWLREGLLDMLMVGGGYMPYGARLHEFIDMAHRYGINAYPCQNHYIDPEPMRSIASGFWALGGDGFYMFNYGGVSPETPRYQCLYQLGGPTTLAGLDKVFQADKGCSIKYVGYTNPPSQFPAPVVGGAPVELVVGDDLAALAAAGTPMRLHLVVSVTGMNTLTSLEDLVTHKLSKEKIGLQINGVAVPDAQIRRLDATRYAAEVEGRCFVNGSNWIRVCPGPGSVGSLEAAVTDMRLTVDYAPFAAEPVAAEPAAAPSNDVLIKPASDLPMSFFDTGVGTSKTVVFEVGRAPAEFKAVRAALVLADVDATEEVRVSFNGGAALTVPDPLLSDTGPRAGTLELPFGQLRQGRNELTFTFASDLNGTTGGFDVNDALLVLTPK